MWALNGNQLSSISRRPRRYRPPEVVACVQTAASRVALRQVAVNSCPQGKRLAAGILGVRVRNMTPHQQAIAATAGQNDLGSAAVMEVGLTGGAGSLGGQVRAGPPAQHVVNGTTPLTRCR